MTLYTQLPTNRDPAGIKISSDMPAHPDPGARPLESAIRGTDATPQATPRKPAEDKTSAVNEQQNCVEGWDADSGPSESPITQPVPSDLTPD